MIILASNSPRRRELLAHITRDFTVQGTDVDESLPAGIAPAAAWSSYPCARRCLSTMERRWSSVPTQ